MIWLRLAGGLGNQLFQLAAAETLRKKTGQDVRVFTGHLKNYATPQPYLLPQLVGKAQVTEADMPSLKEMISRYRINKILPSAFPWFIHNGNLDHATKRKDYLLDDYFQRTGLIKPGIDDVVKKIRNVTANDAALKTIFASLADGLSTGEMAAVHIRRGDYLSKVNQKKFYTLGDEYYGKAISLLPSTVKRIVTFSNDKDYSIGHLTNIEVVPVHTLSLSDVQEFHLMSMFRHFIIANSTFSYWAAIIGKNDISVAVGPSAWAYNRNENESWTENLKEAGFSIG